MFRFDSGFVRMFITVPITDRVSREGKAMGSVCLSVCPFVLFPLYDLNRLSFKLESLYES